MATFNDDLDEMCDEIAADEKPLSADEIMANAQKYVDSLNESQRKAGRPEVF